MAKLILCMAVKNEAATIARAIKSVATVADRAVISIDSKDDQGTRDAALKACADCGLFTEMMEHTWENSFSKMRNGVMAHAEKDASPDDWLLWIDGHEYLHPEHKGLLKQFIETAPPHLWLASVQLKMQGNDDIWRDSFQQAKLWRCGHGNQCNICTYSQGIHYQDRAMHNQICIRSCPPGNRCGLPEVHVRHSRTMENATVRAKQRNELLPELLLPKAKAVGQLGKSWAGIGAWVAPVATAIKEAPKAGWRAYKSRTQDEDALFHMLAHWAQIGDYRRFFKLWRHFSHIKTRMAPDCEYQVWIYRANMHLHKMVRARRSKLSRVYRARMVEEAFGALAEAERLSFNRNDHHMARGRIFFNLGKEKQKEWTRIKRRGVSRWDWAMRLARNWKRFGRWYMARRKEKKQLLADRLGKIEFMKLHHYMKADRQFEIAGTFETPVSQSFAQESNYTWEHFAARASVKERIGAIQDAWLLHNKAFQNGGLSTANNIMRLECRAARELFESQKWPALEGQPRLLIIDKMGQFSGDIARVLAQWYSVRVIQQPEVAHVGLANVIWLEWADDNAAFISKVNRPHKHIFARLHGYETIEQTFPAQITWAHIDVLVAVSNQIAKYMLDRFGQIPCQVVRIPNGLDLSKFTYRERKPGLNVAWISMLNNKKNIGLLALAARTFPDHTFHVAGPWQDPRLKEYFQRCQRESGVDNLIYVGHVTDVDAFLEDKNYLLNASLWESFSFACHEAMAKGIKPLVHSWVGIEEFFPEDMRWESMADLAKHLDNADGYSSERYRKMAEQYDVRAVASEFHKLIMGVAQGKAQKEVKK